MLDFYIIKDEQKKPNNPGKLGRDYAGGLDYKTFSNLQNKGIIDNRFDYYSDFRLDTKLINQIRLQIIQKNMQTDTDVILLLQILNMTEINQCGLMAYCD